MYLKKNSSTIERDFASISEEVSKKPIQNTYDLVVFSHLRWNFVYQRPQHLISRLSKHYRTLFIEEPIHHSEEEHGTFELETVLPNLQVLRPRVHSISEIKEILEKLKIRNIQIAWFYSAAFGELVSNLNPKTVIYDCMDELSLFKGADQQLVVQEQQLLKRADLVFTGGKSLYESKSAHSQNVHCFPSSVDLAHFQKALNSIPVPEDIAQIPRPVVGYIGVIDERIDIELLAAVAEANPAYSFVMIGPVVKISEEDLPRNSNIHYLGMKNYKELPQYLKAIDIAMMPFALNDATKFISPTKTLEYMAAGKPIISTAIKDVVRDYSDSVSIIKDCQDFSEALQHIRNKQEDNQIKYYEDILQRTSWDNTSSNMLNLIKNL